MDLGPEMLERAKASGVTPLRANVEDLSTFAGDSFGFVTCLETPELLEQPDFALAQSYRVLK